MLDALTIGDSTYDIFVKPSGDNQKLNLKLATTFVNEGAFCFPVGAKISLSEADFKIGGSAANVAVGLARLGLETAACSGLGEDNFAEDIESSLNNEDVSIDYIKRNHLNKTNFAVIIRGDKDRTILVYHGMKDYGRLPLPDKNVSKWLYLSPLGQGYEKTFSKIISLRAEGGVKLAFNPGSVQLAHFHNLSSILRLTDILFVNYEEAILASDWRGPKPTPKDLLKALLSKGVKTAIVTLGREGLVAAFEGVFLKASAATAKRVEVTGAGDAMATGFMASTILAETESELLSPLELFNRSILWGSIESASVIEAIGAQTNLLAKTELEARAEQAKGLTIAEF